MNENNATQDTGKRRQILWPLIPGFAVLAAFALRTIARSDLWMHLASGRWIMAHGIPRADVFAFTTSPDKPWINNSWLYDVMVHAIWQAGGAPLVVGIHAAMVLAAFLCLVPVARKRAGAVGMMFGLTLCGWLLAGSLDATPATFCLVFPSLFLLVLDAGIAAPTAAFLLVPAQILWTNCHESFVLGPLLAGLFSLEARVRARRPAPAGDAAPRDWLPLAMLAVALLLCSLANPYGRALWQYVTRSIADIRYHPTLEWALFSAQFVWTPRTYLTTATLVLFAAGFVCYRERLPLALTIVAVIGAFVMVRAPQQVETWIVMAFPFVGLTVSAVSATIDNALGRRAPGLSRAWQAAGLAFSLFAAFASIAAGAGNYYYNRSGSGASFGWTVQHDLFPAELAVRALDAFGTNHVVNLPVDGDYLAWQRPDKRVFTDSRASVYGAGFYQRLQLGLMGSTNAWNDLMDTWRPAGVLLNCTWPGTSIALTHLLRSGQWRLVYFDGLTALAARAESRNRKLIADSSLQQGGLRALEEAHQAYRSAIAGGACCPPNPPSLIGAAFVFQAMNRLEEAESLYEILNRGAPSMLVGYVNRGVCLVRLGRFEEAASVLEQTARTMPRDLYVWVWLSKAYRGMDRTADAERAEATARSINQRAADRLLMTETPGATKDPAPSSAR